MLGRLISDNIMFAYKAHHYFKCKTQRKVGVTALKVDMSKAYGRVKWEFLRDVMAKMGFEQKWVNVLMEIVSSVQYHFFFFNILVFLAAKTMRIMGKFTVKEAETICIREVFNRVERYGNGKC